MEITVENAIARFPEFRFRKPLFWKMADGESWAVIGPNGAGKTLFSDTFQGNVALREGSVRHTGSDGKTVCGGVVSLVFRDIYSMAGVRSMYSQQRWNSRDAEESPFAISLLDGCGGELFSEYADLLGLDSLTGKRVVSLSSGELRKLLIIRALMREPRVIVLDNPFIGLDAASRQSLDEMLAALKDRKGLQTVLVLSQTKDIPVWTDKIQPVCRLDLLPPMTREAFMSDPGVRNRLFGSGEEGPSGRLALPLPVKAGDYRNVLEMHDVRVRYGGKSILDGVDWTVRKGERWALLGRNGSGKSTLLSLVCGDNPQAYSNDIALFDRRRGTGESIWDIKRRIGYLSPDTHTYYMEDIPCLKVVASGFHDSVGLFRECTESQYAAARAWLEIFRAEHLADRSFLRISYGEQRLVLLARAFVKSPELLILDEPLHGLDAGRKILAGKIIESYCRNPEVTLIYVSHYEDEIPGCVGLRKIMR